MQKKPSSIIKFWEQIQANKKLVLEKRMLLMTKKNDQKNKNY